MLLLHIMQIPSFPTTQGALIRAVRGSATQAEFAKRVGVDRSCLSRYEREELGAPTALINYCLRAMAGRAPQEVESATALQRALSHAQQVISELEAMAVATSKPRRRSDAHPERPA